MTVRDVGNLVVYLGAIAAALTAIGVVFRFAVLRPLRRWAERELRGPMQAIGTEVGADSQGPTLKDLILNTSWRMTNLERRFDDHMKNHPGSTP